MKTRGVLLLLLLCIQAAANPQQESSLGVVLAEIPLPPNPAAGIPMRNMVLIRQVLPNCPAALAVLQPGDGILGIDNSPAVHSSDLTRGIENRANKDAVTLTIMRRTGLGQYVPMAVRVQLPPSLSQESVIAKAKPGRPTAEWLGIKLNVKAQPVKVHFNEYRTCYAVGPPDWFVWGHRKEGDAADVGAPDFSYASWSGLGVTVYMQNLPEFATPETHIKLSLSGFAHVPVTYGEPIQDEFGYIWLPYVKEHPKSPSRGVYIYRVVPVPQDPRAYVLISRIAQTPKHLWAEKGDVALRVGLSIRCNVQLRPSPDNPRRPASVDDRRESTYNQQLGTEYAHNPETGEIYWMNHTSDWRETGPQGPGYYVRSGNEWKKLEQGLGCQ